MRVMLMPVIEPKLVAVLKLEKPFGHAIGPILNMGHGKRKEWKGWAGRTLAVPLPGG